MVRKVHLGTCLICNKKDVKLANVFKSICKKCYKDKMQPKKVCVGCGKTKNVGKNTEAGPLCDSCSKRDYSAPKLNCYSCGELRIVRKRDSIGNPICDKCYVPPKKKCSKCGKIRKVNAVSEIGPVCGSCYVSSKSVCSVCGELAPIYLKNNMSCKKCYVPPAHKCCMCGNINQAGKLLEDGSRICIYCYESPKEKCSVCRKSRPVISHDCNGNPLCNACYIAYRRKTDEKFYVSSNLRTRLSEAFRTYSSGGKVKTSKEYGIDYNAIFLHLGACPGNRSDYHIDHIKPLCMFDFDNLDEIKLAFAPENHQWLLKTENLKKGKKYKE